MDIVLDKLINVGGAFVILSLVVEKIADFLKLRNEKLRVKLTDENAEKKRAHGILKRNIIVGVLLALFMKADSIQMLVSGVPAEVLGWENVAFYNEVNISDMSYSNFTYFKTLHGIDTSFFKLMFTWVQMLIGIIVTGVALSFGSKFWHDLVGLLYEIKEAKSKLNKP